MRHSHIYALVASLTLTTALVLVVGGEPAPEPSPEDDAVTAAIAETTTTSLDLVISENEMQALVLSKVEEALTAAAADTTTTTTTTVPSTTTTAPPAKSTPTTAPKTKTTSPPTTQPPATTTTTQAGGFRSDYEAEFRSLINSLRASNGLGSLKSDGSLNARARDWAKKQPEFGELKHSNLSSLLPPWMAAGENLGVGSSVSSIFKSLKSSDYHRKIMLGDFTHVGIGVWQDPSGTLWTVHVFTR